MWRTDPEVRRIHTQTRYTMRSSRIALIHESPIDDEDGSQRFRKLDKVLERVNKEIQDRKTDPLMGDIITIETLYFPANSDWKVEDEAKVADLFRRLATTHEQLTPHFVLGSPVSVSLHLFDSHIL